MSQNNTKLRIVKHIGDVDKKKVSWFSVSFSWKKLFSFPKKHKKPEFEEIVSSIVDDVNTMDVIRNNKYKEKDYKQVNFMGRNNFAPKVIYASDRRYIIVKKDNYREEQGNKGLEGGVKLGNMTSDFFKGCKSGDLIRFRFGEHPDAGKKCEIKEYYARFKRIKDKDIIPTYRREQKEFRNRQSLIRIEEAKRAEAERLAEEELRKQKDIAARKARVGRYRDYVRKRYNPQMTIKRYDEAVDGPRGNVNKSSRVVDKVIKVRFASLIETSVN